MRTFKEHLRYLEESAGIQASLQSVKVKRVEKTNDRSHGEARYDNNTIMLFDKFMDLPADAKRHVLFHEVGHWFRDKYFELRDIMGWDEGEGFYNLFGAGNSEEGFAEAFAVYFTERKTLEKRYPEPYRILHDKLNGSEKSIVAWVDKTLKQHGS